MAGEAFEEVVGNIEVVLGTLVVPLVIIDNILVGPLEVVRKADPLVAIPFQPFKAAFAPFKVVAFVP